MLIDSLDKLINILKLLVEPLLATGILTIIISKFFDRNIKRKKLFADAYKTVLSWQEMLYKIRRRNNSKEEESKLIREFHTLQKQMNFYKGMFSIESKSLGLSYQEFINKVKLKTSDLIFEAWSKKGKNPSSIYHKKSKHPNISQESELFLTDIRNWLSWFLIPKFKVVWRNRIKPWKENRRLKRKNA